MHYTIKICNYPTCFAKCYETPEEDFHSPAFMGQPNGIAIKSVVWDFPFWSTVAYVVPPSEEWLVNTNEHVRLVQREANSGYY